MGRNQNSSNDAEDTQGGYRSPEGGRRRRRPGILWWILCLLLIGGAFFLGTQAGEGPWQKLLPGNETVNPRGDHDVTLEDNGILGYTAADFEKVIIEKSTQQHQLIVDEEEVSVPTTITVAGAFDLDILSKTAHETVSGTGQYTVDLGKVDGDSISLDEDSLTVTVKVPAPELHNVSFDPEKTVIGATDRGWLAFGEVKMTEKERKTFETTAVKKLTARLKEEDCVSRAQKFARLSCEDLYSPIVSAISPAYKVQIVVGEQQ